MAFVEDKIDDRQHALDTLRPVGPVGHLIGNGQVADLGLGTDDALAMVGAGVRKARACPA
jgi:hypothetical protein